jgi:hypothetical protein
MTTATKRILQEEGAEVALADLGEKVTEAAAAMRSLLHEDKGRTWTIRQLQDAAARSGWSSSVMSLAFLRLLQEGVVEVDADLRVHAL